MNKILAICTSPDKGGLELYFVKLVNYYHNKKLPIISVCQADSLISKIIKSPIFFVKKLGILNIFINAYTISKKIRDKNINIIHVSWTKDLLLAVLIKLFSKENISIIYYRQMKITRNKKDIYHKFIYKNISRVLVITKQLQSDCQRYLPIAPNKIIHLKYGIQIPNKVINAKEGRKEIYKRFNLNDQLFTIGVFSRIEEQKGQHLVVEALNSINNKDIQLLIIGHCMDNKYLDKLNNMIDEFKLQKQISITSFIESPMELMPLLDLVILPTYEETFGLVVAESMLMGTPVIGSNAGGVPEIIEDKINGLLFEPKNYKSLKEEIVRISNSLELRKKLSDNAKIFAKENYDYQTHFSNLDNILNDL